MEGSNIYMICVYLTYQNVTKMIMYPLSSFDNYDNNIVISYAGVLHVYHNIFFKMKMGQLLYFLKKV